MHGRRSSFRITEHNADFLTKLVNEDRYRLGFADCTRQAYEALGTSNELAGRHGNRPFRLQFPPSERVRDGIDNDNIDCTASYESFGDFERLLTSIRLRKQQFIDVNTKFASIHRIKRMLGIDKCSLSASSLNLCNCMKATVVLPDDSGPYTSIIRPLGNPPIPRQYLAQGNRWKQFQPAYAWILQASLWSLYRIVSLFDAKPYRAQHDDLTTNPHPSMIYSIMIPCFDCVDKTFSNIYSYFSHWPNEQ